MGEQVDCLEITTVASCTVRCAICPQDVLKAAYRDAPHRLSMHDYLRVLNNVPVHVRIHFSGLVEPWLNPDATLMLKWALHLRRRVAIYTTLVGMSDPSLVAEALREFRHMVDVVCIHEADGTNMKPQDVDVDAFVKLLDGVNVERMKMAGPGFEAIDRAGLVQIGKAPFHHKGPIKCSYTNTYTHNVMLPNGDVHLCCMDYGLKHRIGNLFTQRWDELDRSAVAKDNACGDGSTICRKCHGAVPA